MNTKVRRLVPLFLLVLVLPLGLLILSQCSRAADPTNAPVVSTNITASTTNMPGLVLTNAASVNAAGTLESKLVEWKIVKLIILLTGVGLIICFSAVVWFLPKHAKDFEPYFGHGLLLQTIVVIIVVESVLALAVGGVLKATEVSAIYGGIVGYILGKDLKKTPDPPKPPES
jgi:hypothetical protein